MFVGILFTVVVSLVVAAFSVLTFTHYRNVRSEFAASAPLAFALFWLGMSVVWFLTALSDFFTYLDMRYISFFLTYCLQLFVGGSLIAALYFLHSALLKGRGRIIFVSIYVLLYVVFVSNLFWYGVRIHPENFFSNQITSPEQALAVFVMMFVPLWILAFGLFFKTLAQRKRLDPLLYRFYLLSSLSLIILGIAGSADEVAIVTGPIVTASRLVSLVSAICAFFAISALTEPEDLII